MANQDNNDTTIVNAGQGEDPMAGMKAVADELKQNIGDLANAVCELEGVVKSELLNDIGVAEQEVKQFKKSISKADDDFEKFLKKLEDFELDPVEVELPAPRIYYINQGGKEESGFWKWVDRIDKALGIVDHSINIFKAGRDIYKGIKGFRSSEANEDFEDLEDEGTSGDNASNMEEGLEGNQPSEVGEESMDDFASTEGEITTNYGPAENLTEINPELASSASTDMGAVSSEVVSTTESVTGIATDIEGTALTDAATTTATDVAATTAADVGVSTAADVATDVVVTEGAESIGAMLATDALAGVEFGPLGMLAGLGIGLIGYGIGKLFSSDDDDKPKQPAPLPQQQPVGNSNAQIAIDDAQEAVDYDIGKNDTVALARDQADLKRLQKKKEDEENFAKMYPDHDLVRAYSPDENKEYDDYKKNIEGDPGTNWWAGTSLSPALSEYKYFENKKKEDGAKNAVNAPHAYNWDISKLSAPGIAPGTTHEAAHPTYTAATDATYVRKPFQMQPAYAGSIGNVKNESKCVTVNVNIRTNADIHNNTFNSTSVTGKEIQDKIMEVLLGAISDSKVGAATH